MDKIDKIVSALKAVDYADIFKLGLIFLLASPVIALWKTEEYLSKNGLPPHILFYRQLKIEKIGACRKWVLKKDGMVEYNIEFVAEYNEEQETKLMVTFSSPPDVKKSKTTCTQLIDFANKARTILGVE
jgi:hypothetical protein